MLLKRLFRFVVNEGGTAVSSAKVGKPPKNDAAPTMPLVRDEIRAVFAAAGSPTRERALLMLMRYSGLAMRDASTLRRDALDGADLTMRRAKSGELVFCTLPAPVAEKAGVQAFRMHRLRDEFAAELLFPDVPMEDGSVLLGHSSVQTTGRYYALQDQSRHPSSSQDRWSDQDIGIIAIGFTGHGALVRSEPGRSESPAATGGPSARAWSRWAGRSWRRAGAGSRRSPAAGGRRRAS